MTNHSSILAMLVGPAWHGTQFHWVMQALHHNKAVIHEGGKDMNSQLFKLSQIVDSFLLLLLLLFSLRIVPFWSFSFGFVLLLLFVCFLFLVFVCLFWGVFFCFCFVLAGRGGKYCFGSKRHCLCSARSLSGLKYYVFSGTSPEISWNCQLSYHQKICINNPRRFFLELFFFS